MIQRGIEARVVTVGKNKLSNFPLLTTPVEISEDELVALPWTNQRVVATFWSTAYLVDDLLKHHPDLKGYYYIQDYEPWFYEEGSEDRKKAEATYLLPLKGVAKTKFLVETVKKHHEQDVELVSPGIDRGVFYPDWGRKSRAHPPQFAAMYRPRTPRRGSERLLDFIDELLNRMPEARIVLFGDTEECALPEATAHRVKLMGRLTRKQVAALYRESTFSVDLSYFHGFGRMGIESMACGAIPILTPSGGVSEYAVNDKNSLIIYLEDFNGAINRVI